jgi:hypothetical protein
MFEIESLGNQTICKKMFEIPFEPDVSEFGLDRRSAKFNLVSGDLIPGRPLNAFGIPKHPLALGPDLHFRIQLPQ